MHIISLRKLKEFWRRHPDAENPLRRWYKIAKKAKWQSLADNRNDFPHADLVGVCTIFNIKGNSYRLVTKIYYDSQLVLTRFVMTHAEYDKGEWTDDCEC
ncbi:MAG TPA: type II toxin-antitoxin system HigB family toxin [Pyrinomonadaceae bacterium]|jgi:mRNA interferase HigB